MSAGWSFEYDFDRGVRFFLINPVIWIGLKGKKLNNMTYHCYKNWMNIHVFCILKNEPFTILPVVLSWGVNMKGKCTAHGIILNDFFAHVHVLKYKDVHAWIF